MNVTVYLEHLGKDLLMTPFFEADEWNSLDLTTNPSGSVYLDETVDLAGTQGVETLQQALILRLLTPLGSLADLGHANYGSRLHELIGEENNDNTRFRARSYIIQAIGQEKRIEKILSLEIDLATPDAPDRLRIFVRVKPKGPADPVALGLEVVL